MGFTEQCREGAIENIMKLYETFIGTDATLLEINPMAEDNNGKSKLFSWSSFALSNLLLQFTAWTAS